MILSYAKFVLKREIAFFKDLKEKTGVGFAEYYGLSILSNKNNTSLFKKPIRVADAFWHVHSLNELFVDEIYKLKINTPNPYILDCGSNVGLSILYFKSHFPLAKIVGFEPDPAIFDMMKYNLSNHDYKNIELVNKAVWTENGKLFFNATGALGGALDLNQSAEVNNKVEVATVRLRDYLLNEKVDLLKIDVEGAEFEILDDCLDVLYNVDNIFIEYHRPRGGSQAIGSYLTKLEDAGFRLYIKEAWNNLPHPFRYDDYSPMYDLQLNIFGFKK